MVGFKGTEPAGCILVGKVGKPHGIRGELKIYSLSGQPENFRDYPQLVLIEAGGQRLEFTVTAFRAQGKFAVVALDGVADRNQAEALADCQVWVAKEYLAPLTDDEFYWHDVIGAEVVDIGGKSLGQLTSLITAGGVDLLVVQQDGEEILIPNRPEFLVKIGSEQIIVDLPPGFLDINRKK